MIEDFDLINASFLSQYGIRLSRDLKGMKWDEFQALLVGIDPKSPLGRIVSIRSEDDGEILKYFTPEQHRVRNEWRSKQVNAMTVDDTNAILSAWESAFASM